MSRRFAVCTLAICVFGAAHTAFAQLRVQGSPVFAVDPGTNAAASVVGIENPSNKPVPVRLEGAAFTSEYGQTFQGTMKFAAAGETTSSAFYRPAQPLAKGGVLRLVVTISDVWPAGTSTAAILNDGKPVGQVRMVKDRFAFKVSPQGWKQDAPLVVSIERGAATSLVLHNDDPMHYTVNWRLTHDGMVTTGEKIRVPANSDTNILLAKAGDMLSPRGTPPLSELLRDGDSEALLNVTAVSNDGSAIPYWPTRSFPVKLRRSWLGPDARSFVGFAIVFTALALGGVSSLFLSYFVPNRNRRSAVIQRIEALSPRMRSLPEILDSNVRVMLRVERLRLLDRMKARVVLSPDFALLAADVDAHAAGLEKAVGLAEEIETTLVMIGNGTYGFAPTVLCEALGYLRNAQAQLAVAQFPESALSRTQESLGKARGVLESMRVMSLDRQAAFAKRIDDLINAVKGAFWDAAGKQIVDLKKYVQTRFAKTEALAGLDLCELDSLTARACLVQEVGEIVDALTDDERKALQSCLQDFLTNLKRSNLDSYVAAEQMAVEIRERFYPEHLIEAIQNGKASIRVDPAHPLYNEAATFRLVFDNNAYNLAAARQRLQCLWDFGDGFKGERGWEVSHYYSAQSNKGKGKPFPVAVRFLDASGVAIDSGNPIGINLVVAPDRDSQVGEKTKIEILRLVVILMAAVFGLYAGAYEQLMRLDLIPGLITVFLLGFSADQIKNILAPKPM